MTTENELHDRAAIVTCGVAAKDIPGLVNLDTMDMTSPETFAFWQSQRRETYPHEEMFGEACTVTQFIECPVEMAYAYASNLYSLEEWTATLRGFQPVGGGLYCGIDAIAKDTPIYMRIEAHPGPRLVDYLCAWDQGQDLWMRYYIRFVDALPTLGKAGTVLIWTNCKHSFYGHDSPAPPHVAGPRARGDRLWVGALWDLFYAGHRIEAQNLKTILEHRWRAQEAAAQRAGE
jgi:hypothetical protein